jgi:hypothetical protein
MNKKTAFTVVAKLLLKQGFVITNSVINVPVANVNLSEVKG